MPAGIAGIGQGGDRYSMSQGALDQLFLDDLDGSTAAQITQRSLIDTQERLGMMLDVMPVGLIIHTQQGILFANQQACRLLQISNAEAVGHHILDFVPIGEVELVQLQLTHAFGHTAAVEEREIRLVREDGTILDVKLISCPLPWEGNPVVQLLIQDVTELKRSEQALRRLSITDELTGAFNRRHAFYEASLYVGAEATHKIPLSVILIDVDHFKLINDCHGHAAGDRALKDLASVSKALLQSLPQSQSTMFARIGGEEFLLLLPSYSIDDAARVAAQLRKAVGRIRVSEAGRAFGFTISLGVAAYAATDLTLEGLLSRADKALYEAKETGRNRVMVA